MPARASSLLHARERIATPVTTSTAREIERRLRGYEKKPKSAREFISRTFRDLRLELEGDSWFFDKYQQDLVGFAIEVLGAVIYEKGKVYPPKSLILWPRQLEILRAIPKYKRVSVRSGHKVSKSTTAAIVAIWFYCCFEEARVLLTSATSRQVDAILWREIKKMHSRALRPIPGEPRGLARTGLKKDLREIVGFTARETEAVAGVSGIHVFYVVDEATGVANEIFEAIEGNRAGGDAWSLFFSNPTKTDGEFYESQTSKALVEHEDGTVSGFYKCFAISSEETPNVIEGRDVIPGLARRDYIEEKKREWGEDSAIYRIRVKGEFVLNEQGKIVSVDLLTAAELRYDETPWEGQLYIGIDPAGPGGQGDDSAFATRRGFKIRSVNARRGMSAEAHLEEAIGIIRLEQRAYPLDFEQPVVVVDCDGPVGWEVYSVFRAYANQHKEGPETFRLIGFRGGDWAKKKPDEFERQRDEALWFFQEWLKKGGAIPTDARLEKELNAPEWISKPDERMKSTAKKDLKLMLGHSPDLFDACFLSTWELVNFQARIAKVQQETRRAPIPARIPQIDAYGALDAWRPKR